MQARNLVLADSIYLLASMTYEIFPVPIASIVCELRKK